MITLKSIEINPIENPTLKQIKLNWNLENGVEINHSVTIQSPLAVDDVLKALKELQDLVSNDSTLLNKEQQKEEWKKKYIKRLIDVYNLNEELAKNIFDAGIDGHDYSENPEDMADEEMSYWRE